MPSIIALIPARAGSRRVPGKNTRYLGGKPLIAWTIEAAKESGIFERIIVCSDDCECEDIATAYQVDFIGRATSADDEPDIAWVRKVLEPMKYDAFAILRPTSPFRTVASIRRAWVQFQSVQPWCDSLRAVRPIREHPGKMWLVWNDRLLPILPWGYPVPWHSSPTQTLPQIWLQTGGLEIAWTRTVLIQGTIAGTNIMPFHPPNIEQFDINTESDFDEAERLISQGVICP